MQTPLHFGQLAVGGEAPPVFLPDIDVYFKGDVPLALALVEALRAAGVKAVKGALIHDLDICFDGPVEVTYHRPGAGTVRERYREVMKRHLLPLDGAHAIYQRVRDLGMEVVLTVYDAAGVDAALAMGAVALKIASSNITHAPLIRRVARTGLPMLMDTGRASLEEIARAVRWAQDAGAERLLLQHSPEAPPAPLERHHLRMMRTLAHLFGCPVGLSDHHAGNEMMLAAVALGAAVVEKGVCADDAAPDIDLAHAARIHEVPGIVRQLRDVWTALGEPMRRLPANGPRPVDRMGLVAARPIRPGARLCADDVRFAFALPADAVPVEDWDQADGARVATALQAGVPIRWADLHRA